jgi:hypothetical protein
MYIGFSGREFWRSAIGGGKRLAFFVFHPAFREDNQRRQVIYFFQKILSLFAIFVLHGSARHVILSALFDNMTHGAWLSRKSPSSQKVD